MRKEETTHAESTDENGRHSDAVSSLVPLGAGIRTCCCMQEVLGMSARGVVQVEEGEGEGMEHGGGGRRVGRCCLLMRHAEEGCGPDGLLTRCQECLAIESEWGDSPSSVDMGTSSSS